MKKFLSKLVVFLAITFIVYCVFLVSWTYVCKFDFFRGNVVQSGGYGFMNSRLKEVKSTENITVLFMGSSHAYRSFDTRYYAEKGIKAFNLGSSSQTPIQTKLLLDKYLVKLNPKLVVLEVFPKTFELDGVESALDIMSNYKVDFKDLQMCLDLNSIKCYNTFLNSCFSNLIYLNDNYVEPFKWYDNQYIPNGFVEKELSYNNDSLKIFQKCFWKPKSSQIKAFEEIIYVLNSKKIPFLLIQVPYNSKWYQSYEDKNRFNDYFASQGKYLNFNDSTFFNMRDDFYDHDHLNSNGVRKLNISLLKELQPIVK